MGKKTRVYCKDLDVWFSSIKEAAAYAKVDGWTMSKKMDLMGSYKDNENRTYVRETPMQTKNKYHTKTNYSSIKRSSYKRKPNEKKNSFKFCELPKIVQELINKTATDMILQEKPWREVKSFLRSMGAKQLILTLGDDDAE